MHRRHDVTARCFALALAALALLSSSPAQAESGHFNFHFELASGTPVLGLTAGGDEFSLGALAFTGFDYQWDGPVALEFIAGGGYFLEPESEGSPGDTEYVTAALGVRVRYLDNREGYLDEEGGDRFGNFWLSGHVGYHFFDGHQAGVDAAIGYEWSIFRPLQIGAYVRAAFTFAGQGFFADALVITGMSFSLEGAGRPAPQDGDHDGLSDERESSLHRTDSQNADTDGDLLPDGAELRLGADPLVRDSDGDGLLDGVEDRNHDGVIGPGETHPAHNDTDGGGVLDGYELDHGMDPLRPEDDDDDDDGVLEDSDECPGSPLGLAVEGDGCATLPSRSLVASDAFELDGGLRDSAEPELLRLARVLRDRTGARARVRGLHAIAADPVAQALAQARAEALVAWLVARGLDAERFTLEVAAGLVEGVELRFDAHGPTE